MKKFRTRNVIKKCPLAACILCSWAVLAATEYFPQLADTLTGAQNETAESGQADTAVDAGGAASSERADGEMQLIDPNGLLGGVIAANPAPNLSERAIMQGDEDEPADHTPPDGKPDAAQEPQKTQKTKPECITYDKKQTDSPWYTDPGKIPLTTAYDYKKVKKDYFDDAVFIGDSRIVGMYDYSGLTNATFFAKTGLTVYNLLDDKFVKDPDSGKTVSVSDMMKSHTYGKIYLMVGINELGAGGTQRFQEAYKEVLKKFRKWQPDAVIYVQSIMGVSPSKDKSDPVFNNTNIRDKNAAIAELTDGIHIFYLNIQEIYEDENHNLKQELTFDDVHLYAQHYDQWVKYLKTHAVVKEA